MIEYDELLFDRHMLIYGLCEPNSGRLLYVGKSSRGLVRPSQHWTRRPRTPCDRWARKVVDGGDEPIVEILEDLGMFATISRRDANALLDDAERSWIAFMKVIGCHLLNMTDGGDGGVPSLETRLKLSVAAANRTGDRNAFYGRRHSSFSKELMSLAQKGKRHSASSRAKMSVKTRGENNPLYGLYGSAHPKFGKGKRVICIDDGAVYSTMSAVIERYGISWKKLRRQCNGGGPNFKFLLTDGDPDGHQA